jgi:4'-phosphopantetheinyl transferase
MKPSPQSLPLLPLERREAHLWYVFPKALTDPVLLDAYHDLMCPEERVQQRRFYFEKGRHEYLVTRALVRTTLSRYVKLDPRMWRFAKNAYGRPEIAHPQGILPLGFNLSHTDGLIVCLVALDREVGVDVEDTERPGMTVEIANQFFSPAEVKALQALPVSAQRHRFFEYWTLKEAYIKARGMGVSLPLEQFSFHLKAGRPVRISFDPRLQDDPLSWQFVQFRPTPRHMMAVAIRRGADSDLNIRVRQAVPLVF